MTWPRRYIYTYTYIYTYILTADDVAAQLPAGTAMCICESLANAHAAPADAIDLYLIARVVEHIHAAGGEGAVLVFVPGWFEIAEIVKLLNASPRARELLIYPLHSRMPTAEQQAKDVGCGM